MTDSYIVVRCRGRIVFGNEVDEIAQRVRALDPSKHCVIVDLSMLDELRSGNLGLLWLKYVEAKAAGWRIAFVHLPEGLIGLLSRHSVSDAFEFTAIKATRCALLVIMLGQRAL
jgi:hypothetical protein